MGNLAIEYLPGKLSRLFENRSSIFRICVVAKVGTLIDKAAASCVHHDSERVAMLLKPITDAQIAEFRRVAVPSDSMASRPVAVWHCTNFQRHTDAVARVEARPPHFSEIPSGSQIARTPFRVSFEAAACQHNRFRNEALPP